MTRVKFLHVLNNNGTKKKAKEQRVVEKCEVIFYSLMSLNQSISSSKGGRNASERQSRMMEAPTGQG